MAKVEFADRRDLQTKLKNLAEHLEWDGEFQPETLAIMDFLFAKVNADFASSVRPMTSFLFDRLSTLAEPTNDPISPWSEIEWAAGMTHPDRTVREVVAYTADYMSRAFRIFSEKPLNEGALGLALPGDLLAFARSKLALGFQYNAGESIFNCVPNSIYFLMICDLWLLSAEGHAEAKDQKAFELDCRRAKLALAAEHAYLLVYHPSLARNEKLQLNDYNYMNGPFPNRLSDEQAQVILETATALPDSIEVLRLRHRHACQGATMPLPSPIHPRSS